MAFAERFVVTALTQVTRYLTDEMIRALAQQRVLDLVEDDTRVDDRPLARLGRGL